ncbi:MAG TPA: hemerythrin domain-containing protein [Gammaproteobacteria bacterium]|nr:hemerythrin domain-containing protein [Gammaproteobacteria bacterium]
MTSIPVLLSTGHRLFHALLMQARAAAQEAAWAEAQASLAEVARRLEAQMRAEETVLFPRLAGQGAEVDAMLAQCRREHGALRSQVRVAIAAAEVRDRTACGALLAHLIEALSSHCRDEEQRVYTLTRTMDEGVLGALARALSAAGDDEGAPDTVGVPRLH